MMTIKYLAPLRQNGPSSESKAAVKTGAPLGPGPYYRVYPPLCRPQRAVSAQVVRLPISNRTQYTHISLLLTA